MCIQSIHYFPGEDEKADVDCHGGRLWDPRIWREFNKAGDLILCRGLRPLHNNFGLPPGGAFVMQFYLYISLAMPKSAILTVRPGPLVVRRQFRAAMSLWMKWFSSRYLQPLATSTAQPRRSFMVRGDTRSCWGSEKKVTFFINIYQGGKIWNLKSTIKSLNLRVLDGIRVRRSWGLRRRGAREWWICKRREEWNLAPNSKIWWTNGRTSDAYRSRHR